MAHNVRKLAVIGDPISHSLSPLLHNTMARELGLAYAYEACRVSVAQLPDWLARVQCEDYAGFNATMPHKVHLLPLMHHLTAPAQQLGAVNTVKNENGILIGHNTDGAGFSASLADHGRGFCGAHVTILGAGGAAGAIAGAARQAGAARINIMNRTLAKAQVLCDGADGVMQALPLDAPVPPETELLINTIPIGNNLETAFVKHLSKRCAVFDILYAPPKTPLLLAAEEAGLLAVNGLGMLIHQAIGAFSFFTGQAVAETEMAAILFEKMQNV